MKKINWMLWLVVAACGVAVLAVFSILFKNFAGEALPWWAYVAAIIIYVLVVYLVSLLRARSGEKFDIMLSREGFNAQKRYVWDKHILYVDFDSKRIANKYISTLPLVPFSSIEGFRIESYRSNSDGELPEDERFVSLVLTIHKEGFEYEYLYIPMFEVKIANDDVGEGLVEITAELVEKYPELGEMYELQSDVKQILQINEVNGIRSRVK